MALPDNPDDPDDEFDSPQEKALTAQRDAQYLESAGRRAAYERCTSIEEYVDAVAGRRIAERQALAAAIDAANRRPA